MRRIILLTALLAVSAVAALAVDGRRFRDRPLRLDTPSVFIVEPGQGLRNLAMGWQRNGWLDAARDVEYLVAWTRVFGLDGAIKAGEYRARPGMTALELLGQVIAGEVLAHRFTIIEGWTWYQMLAALQQANTVSTGEAIDDAQSLMRLVGAAGQHPEGRFFPDTYLHARGASELALLRQAYQRMERILAAEWAERDPDIPLKSPDEALVLASIVEKETGGMAAEQRQVAGVFIRRLKRGMRLQADPTVIYGMGERFDGDIRFADLKRDTPYNTYTRHGLPPTPICMPGRAAIHATLHPDDSETLYFVARGDGSHVFSESLAEHNAAVRRYQKRKQDKGGK